MKMFAMNIQMTELMLTQKFNYAMCMCHRRRNRGGTGGMCPPIFHKLLYKLLTTLYVVSDCAPPNQKVFPTPLCVYSVITNSYRKSGQDMEQNLSSVYIYKTTSN